MKSVFIVILAAAFLIGCTKTPQIPTSNNVSSGLNGKSNAIKVDEHEDAKKTASTSIARVNTITPVMQNGNSKILFHPSHLRPVGGFRARGVRLDTNQRYATGSIDKLPGSKKWIMDHGHGDYVIEFIEPDQMGSPNASFEDWPEMTPGRNQKALYDVNQWMGPMAARWLDGDHVIVSGRPTYRAKPLSTFLSILDLNTGEEVKITTPPILDGCDVALGFGGGFVRSPSDDGIYLACGGYDSLGSPFGPSLAKVDPYTGAIQVGLYFPFSDKENRDSAYWYPPSPNAQPPMWVNPEGFVGFWQAGSASFGAAWIDHPRVEGIVYLAQPARGWLDYRAQGNGGSGGGFSVGDCVKFYTELGDGNRWGHSQEYWLADGPSGDTYRTVYTYPPARIVNALNGNSSKQTHGEYRDFPKQFGINRFNSDKVNGITWDNDRKLLWVSYVAPTKTSSLALVAYELDASNPKVDLPVEVPAGWQIDKQTGVFSPVVPIGPSRNGLVGTKQGNWVKLTWSASDLASHVDYQVWSSKSESSGFQVIHTTFDTTCEIEDAEGIYYLITDRVAEDEVHAIRGKIKL